MCTAISFNKSNHYFGRNLDVECDYGQSIVIIPRNFLLKFRLVENIINHYAIIGTAKVENGYPLLFDATNETGLSMAGLRFGKNCVYYKESQNLNNIASFELILWVLSQCKNIKEAWELLETTNVTDIDFSAELPSQPLHWIISDKERSITVETLSTGIKIYENPVGVLTNNPTFDIQMFSLNNYQGISKKNPVNHFSPDVEFNMYSRGLGGLGLPGDFSSQSRFIRAVFFKYNSLCDDSEISEINQFFHMLGLASQLRGAVEISENVYEFTEYSSCCNTDKCIYYYMTYGNSRITAVSMKNENIDGYELIIYNMLKRCDIKHQN